MIKFQTHYVTNGTLKARVSYWLDNRIDGRKCVTIYAKDHSGHLGGIFRNEYKNETDSRTDYFEKGVARLFEDNAHYAAARARAEAIQNKKPSGRQLTLHNKGRDNNMAMYKTLSTAENDFLRHITRFGAAGYPVQKVSGRKWIWTDMWGVKGAPTVYKTRGACVAAIEAYVDVLSDKVAGRLPPSQDSPAYLEQTA